MLSEQSNRIGIVDFNQSSNLFSLEQVETRLHYIYLENMLSR